MFLLLLSTFFEFAITICGILVFYNIFISSYVNEWIYKNNKAKTIKQNANKMALLKLISNDAKDIEKFITANTQFLSDDLVKKLVARVEIINCDRIIYLDSVDSKLDNLDEDDLSKKKMVM